MKAHARTMLALARQAKRTQNALRRWENRPWADSTTEEHRAVIEVQNVIVLLDGAITEALGRYDNTQEARDGK